MKRIEAAGAVGLRREAELTVHLQSSMTRSKSSGVIGQNSLPDTVLARVFLAASLCATIAPSHGSRSFCFAARLSYDIPSY